MRLLLIDVLMIVAYLVLMLMIGWYYRKKARQNKESYLMGGKKLPWYITRKQDGPIFLGITNYKIYAQQTVKTGFVILTQNCEGV